MEKFSNWRDKGTGISPFLPTESTDPPLRKYLINPLVLAVKWPVFIALYVLASVAPKPVTRAIVKHLFSISDIDFSIEGVRKSKRNEINRHRPTKNEIVLSNFVSPLDIIVIFLVSALNSLNGITVVIPSDDVLYSFTAWQVIRLYFDPIAGSVEKGTRLGENIEQTLQGKLVVLFAESSPSNNKAILPLKPKSLDVISLKSFDLKVMVLRYYPGSLSVPVPHVSAVSYVSKLLTLSGKAFIKAKLIPLDSRTLKACQNAFVENGLSQVELGVDEKTKFFEYYKNYALADFRK